MLEFSNIICMTVVDIFNKINLNIRNIHSSENTIILISEAVSIIDEYVSFVHAKEIK